MFLLRRSPKVLAFWFAASIALSAEVPPVSFTLFGLYGSPVQPRVLADSVSDALGLDFLGEWNASPYASLGLSYERTAFYFSSGFTVSMLNFEGRLFPMANGKDKFSPYLYGGAGLNLSSVGGPYQLKAGVGSRVSMIGPLFLDLAVGSHWVQAPNDFQYVDVRAGLSWWLDLKTESQAASPQEASAAALPKPKPSPTATPEPMVLSSPTAAVAAPDTPTATPTEVVLGMEEPTPVVTQAPVTTLIQVKQYYRMGMNAFLKGKYDLSLGLLKNSLAHKEIHGAAYYYAETYATIGVIYEFHSKARNHKKLALGYYEKALAIDPETKSAKRYYKKLKAEFAPRRKHRPAAAKKEPSTEKASPSLQVTYTGW